MDPAATFLILVPVHHTHPTFSRWPPSEILFKDLELLILLQPIPVLWLISLLYPSLNSVNPLHFPRALVFILQILQELTTLHSVPGAKSSFLSYDDHGWVSQPTRL